LLLAEENKVIAIEIADTEVESSPTRLKIQKPFTLLKKVDIKRLNEQMKLNDNVISTYLEIMQSRLLEKTTASNTYIFSSFLLDQMTFYYQQDRKGNQIQETDRPHVIKSHVKKYYGKVKKWTKKTNFF
jgi:Ulp1 family protease